jgi:hypothetical protein
VFSLQNHVKVLVEVPPTPGACTILMKFDVLGNILCVTEKFSCEGFRSLSEEQVKMWQTRWKENSREQ